MTTLDTSHDFELSLPPPQAGNGLDQDEEWVEVELDGERRRIRLHDYGAIYDVPGLYEQVFYERLNCNSPDVVCGLLRAEFERDGVDPTALTALDFGAGNGMVGELLAEMGIASLVGIDLLPEARMAAHRDRPDLYEAYHVLDLSELRRSDRARLDNHDFDLMVCVAALGFGDVPPIAFAEAFNLVAAPGWIAFNIRERFVEDEDSSGFGAFIGRMFDEGVLEERARVSYTHRVSVAGEPLTYLAIVACKQRDVPLDWTQAE
jgi:hypothetical protein